MRPEFKYGLIIGVGLSLWQLAENLLGLRVTYKEAGLWPTYLSTLIPTAALLLLLRQKQRTDPGQQLTLGQAITSGLVASFLGSMIVFVFLLAYNQWINPDWIDNALAVKVAALRAHHIDEADIRREITTFRQINSPIGLVVNPVITLTVTGGILSAAISILLNRQTRSANA
jgi:hypothetical protein